MGTDSLALFGVQRRTAGGGILPPALTHLTRSVLMLCYLPPLFQTPGIGGLAAACAAT
jgi:hypothetical protein